MKVLNIGDNLVSKNISKFYSKDSIDIINITSLESIDSNYNPDIIFLNLNTTMQLDGSEEIKDLQDQIINLKNIYNNSIIFNTTPLLPGGNAKLGVNFLYMDSIKNKYKWFASSDNNASQEILQNFFTLVLSNNLIPENSKLLEVKLNELEIIVYYELLTRSVNRGIFNEIQEYANKLNINIDNICKDLDLEKNDYSISNLIHLSNHYDQLNIPNYILQSTINRFIKRDHPTLDWLPDNGNLDESEESSNLKKLTLTQLNNFCQENNIDITDCIERIDVIEKIINFKKGQVYDIKYLNPKNQNQNQSSGPQMFNVNQPNNTQTNPNIQRQTGVPLQLNPPPRPVNLNRPFNMNVRNNNGNGFMNLRPGSSRGAGGGGIQFGGGVQTVRR